MAVNLGTLLLELQLDGAKFHQDLEAARRSAKLAGDEIERSLQGSSRFKPPKLEPIIPRVDDRELTALNQHLSLKEKHWGQVHTTFSKPIKPKVDTRDLDRQVKPITQEIVYDTRVQRYRDAQGRFTQAQAGLQNQQAQQITQQVSQQISTQNLSVQTQEVQQTVIRDAVIQNAVIETQDVRSQTGVSQTIPQQLAQPRQAPVKVVITDNKESLADVIIRSTVETATEKAASAAIDEGIPVIRQSIAALIDSRFPRVLQQVTGTAGYVDAIRGEGVGAAGVSQSFITDRDVKRFSSQFSYEMELAGQRFGRRAAKELSQGNAGGIGSSFFQTVGELPSNFFKAAFTGVGEFAGNKIGDAFSAEIERAVKDFKSIAEEFSTGTSTRQQENLKRSATTAKKLADEAVAASPSIESKPERVIFATGGFAGQEGKSGHGIASRVQEIVGENAKVVPFENTNFDVKTDAEKNKVGWAGEVAQKTAELAMRGYNPDSIRLAAQVATHKQMNPEADISLMGHSAGGLINQEAAAILKELGIIVNTLSFGTPSVGFVPKSDQGTQRNVMGRGDEFASVPGLNQNREMIGAKGHASGYYLENPEFQQIIKDFAGGQQKTQEAIKEAATFEKAYENLVKGLAGIAEVSANRIPDLRVSESLPAANAANYLPQRNVVEMSKARMDSISGAMQQQVSELTPKRLDEVTRDLSTVAHESFHGGQYGFSGASTSELAERGKPFVSVDALTQEESATFKKLKQGDVSQLAAASTQRWKDQQAERLKQMSPEARDALIGTVSTLETDASTFQAKFMQNFLNLTKTIGKDSQATVAEIFDQALQEALKSVKKLEADIPQSTTQESSGAEPAVDLEAAKAKLESYNTTLLNELARITGKSKLGGKNAIVNRLLTQVSSKDLEDAIAKLEPYILTGTRGGQNLKPIAATQADTDILEQIKAQEKAFNDTLKKANDATGKKRDQLLHELALLSDRNVEWSKSVGRDMLAPETRKAAGAFKGRMESAYRDIRFTNGVSPSSASTSSQVREEGLGDEESLAESAAASPVKGLLSAGLSFIVEPIKNLIVGTIGKIRSLIQAELNALLADSDSFLSKLKVQFESFFAETLANANKAVRKNSNQFADQVSAGFESTVERAATLAGDRGEEVHSYAEIAKAAMYLGSSGGLNTLNAQQSTIVQQIDALEFSDEIKAELKNAFGILKTELAKNSVRGQGANLVTQTESGDLSTFATPEGSFVTLGSTGTHSLSFGATHGQDYVDPTTGKRDPAYNMMFMYDGSFDRAEGLSRREKVDMYKLSQGAYQQQFETIPAGSYMTADAWQGDNAGSGRHNAYVKAGWQQSPYDDSLWRHKTEEGTPGTLSTDDFDRVFDNLEESEIDFDAMAERLNRIERAVSRLSESNPQIAARLSSLNPFSSGDAEESLAEAELPATPDTDIAAIQELLSQVAQMAELELDPNAAEELQHIFNEAQKLAQVAIEREAGGSLGGVAPEVSLPDLDPNSLQAQILNLRESLLDLFIEAQRMARNTAEVLANKAGEAAGQHFGSPQEMQAFVAEKAQQVRGAAGQVAEGAGNIAGQAYGHYQNAQNAAQIAGEGLEALEAKGRKTIDEIVNALDSIPLTGKGEEIVGGFITQIEELKEKYLTAQGIFNQIAQTNFGKSIAASFGSASAVISQVAQGFVLFKFVLMPIIGLVRAYGGEMMNAALEMERFNTVISFASGSTSAASGNIALLRSEVGRLSVDLRTAQSGYAGLLASSKDTSLEGTATNQVFSAVTQASAVYRLDPEKTERVYMALQQIMSKGSVQAEELRGQLGESLPGAFQIAARAMGVTTGELNKLLETGQVTSEEFIPRFAQQLSAETASGVAGASKSATASINRFNNALYEMQATLGKPLLGAKKLGLDIVAPLMNLVAQNADFLAEVLIFLAGSAVVTSVQGIMALGKALMTIPVVAGLVKAALTFLAKTVLPMLIGALKTLAMNFLVFHAAVSVIQMFGKALDNSGGKTKEFATSAKDGLNAYLEMVGKSTQETQKLGGALGDVIERLQNIKSPSLMEETAVGGVAKMLFGNAGTGFLRATERGIQGVLGRDDLIGGAARTATFGLLGNGTTYAEKQANDVSANIGEELVATNQLLSEAYSQFNVNTGEAAGDLKELMDIERELQQVMAQRRALDPSDDAGKRRLGAQEEALLERRAKPAERVGAIQAEITKFLEREEARADEIEKQLAQLGNTPGEQEAKERLQAQYDQVKQTISEAEKMQDRFNSSIDLGADTATRLKREFLNIRAGLEQAKYAADMLASQGQQEVAQNQLAGGLNDGLAQMQTYQNGQEELNARINANIKAMSEFQNLLASPEISRAMSTAGLDFRVNTPDQIRERAQQVGGRDQPILEEAAGNFEQLRQAALETEGLRANMLQAQVDAQQQLRQTSEQVADFYRGIERSAQDAQNSIKQSDLDAVATSAKARLTRSLSKFGDTFFDEFVGGLADLLDQMFEPLRIQLQQMQQTAAINNQLADVTLQGNQTLQNMAPQAGDSLTGAVIQNATGGRPGNIRGVATGTLAAQEYGASRSGGARRHAGQDLDYDVNGRAQSFIGGVVTAIRSDPGGYGNYIDIYNETLGVVERLAEMDQVLVRVGERIGQGQDVGAGTRDTGVIHYEIRTDANAQGIGGNGHQGTVNPIQFLEQRGIVRRQGNQLVPIGGGRAVDMNNNVHSLDDGHNHNPQELGLPANINQPSRTAAPASTAGLTAKGRQLTPEQFSHARTIAETGRRLGASERDIQIAIATAIQESVLSNLNGGDRDSLGLFQQRPSMEWGTRAQIATPQFAAESFFQGRGSNIGLLDVQNRNQLSEVQTSHRVQRSGHPEAIRQWLGEAGAITAATRGASPAAPGQTQYPGMPGVNPGFQMGAGQVNQGMTMAQQSAEEQVAAAQRLAAAQQDMASANLSRSLTQQRQAFDRGIEQLQDQNTSQRQQQEQAAFALLGDSPLAQRMQQGLGQNQEFENQNRDLLRMVRRGERTIEMLNEAKTQILATIEQGRAMGVPEATLQQYTDFLPNLDRAIEQTGTELTELRGQLDQAKELFDLRDQVQQEELDRERRLDRQGRLRQSANLMLQQQANEASMSGNEIGASVIQNRIEVAGIGDRYAEQIAPLQQQLQDITSMQARLEEAGLTLDTDQLEQVQAETAYLNEQIEDLTRHRDIEVEMTLSGLDRIREQLNDTLQQDFTESAATYMDARNDTFGAQALREEFAVGQENERYTNQVAGIEALRGSTQFTNQELDALLEKASQVNELNLENIDAQFKDLGETLADIGKNSLGTFFNDILTGSKSAGEAFKDLISNILSQVAQLAVNALMKDIFGGGGGLGGLFGGGQQQAGGGGLGSALGELFGAGQSIAAPAASGGGGGMGGTLGTIFQLGSMFIGGMKDGGEVSPLDHDAYRSGYGAISEALKREGSNSVLSALTPGETVLTVEQSRKYKQMGGEEIFNFKKGGTVPGGRSVPKAPSGSGDDRKGGDINVPINLAINDGGSADDRDIPAFKQVMEAQIQEVILRESRPGGTLHRRS